MSYLSMAYRPAVSTGAIAIVMMVSATGTTAQTATPAPPPSQTNVTPQQPSDTGDIVVTARKRAESLQDVPISMVAISGDRLNNGPATTLESLNNIAPNLQIFKIVGQSGTYGVFIRGVGRDNPNLYVEAPVALYVDDVIYPYQFGPVLDIGGIERVEVLRGPQGTLYGRNATVGAIKYVMSRPTLDHTTFEMRATGGSYGRAEGSANLRAPLIDDKLGIGLDIGYRHYGGYINDLTTGKKAGGSNVFSGRGSLLWKTSDVAEIYASVDGTHARDPLNLATSIVLDPSGTSYTYRYGSPYNARSSIGQPDINNLDSYGGTIQGRLTYDDVTLRSISAFRVIKQRVATDVIGRGDLAYPGPYLDNSDKTFTQEFQANGNFFESRLQYTAGLFYLSSNSSFIALTSPNSTTRYDAEQHSHSSAAYVDATMKLLGGLSASAGIRYTQDKKTVSTTRTSSLTPAANFSAPGEGKWHAVTPRFGLDWQVTSDILLYGSYSKGYKGGALSNATPANVGAASILVPPERARNSEVGIKTTWFNKRLTFNVDYFHTKYQNQSTAIPIGTNTQIVVNDARISGFEFEARARPVSGLTLAGTLGTLSSKYLNLAPTNSLFGASDLRLKLAPDLSYNFTVDYDHHGLFSETDGINMGVAYNHKSYQHIALNRSVSGAQGAYGVLDSHIGYSLDNGRYQVVLTATNLTDEVYAKQLAVTFSRFTAPPREFAVTFKYRM